MAENVLKNIFTKSRCYYLLITLILLIYLYPALPASPYAFPFLGILFAITPLAGVYAVADERRTLVIATILGAPALLSLLWHFLVPYKMVNDEFLLLLVVVYYAFTTGAIIRHLFRRDRVDTDTILSAISAYLMIGLTFAVTYMLVELTGPGSFVENTGDQMVQWGDMFYFSFVTLTTLGYGDISPVAPHARSLAILEAAAGVLYMSTLIARLVSEYKRSDARSRD
jgi:hypothetical protein